MSLPVNKVVVGDCTEVMASWPVDSVDLVVTSPPYWGLRDYGSETVRVWGGTPECEHRWGESLPATKAGHKNIGFAERSQQNYRGGGHKSVTIAEKHIPADAGQFCSKCGAWCGSLGLEPQPQLFIDHLVEICREIKRVLKPSGTFWLNLGDTYGTHTSKRSGQFGKDIKKGFDDVFTRSRTKEGFSPNFVMEKNLLGIPWRVATTLQDDGWILRNDIIWHKPNHMPSSVKDRLTCSYEHVFLFAKQRRYYFDLDAIRKPQSTSTIQRITQPNVMNQPGGDKQRELRGEGGGNAARSADMMKSLAKKLTKHDIAVGRIGNFSYTDPLHTKEYHPKGKNPGDLWRIPTMPFPGAHFAVFPPKLIEPIVKAGCPRWICSRCGKPRTRLTERVDSGYDGKQHHFGRKSHGGMKSNIEETGIGGKESPFYSAKTVGWSDCGCGEKWVGGIVLDPFAGSGTALKVARRLGRRFIGIEINPEYADMARQRIRGKYRPVPDGIVKLTDILNTEKRTPLKNSDTRARLTELPLNQIIQGDCIEVLQVFPENSVDLVVTDPPYGLNFMGKDWDKALPPKEAFNEMYRVLKPGALAFVMSSPRQDLLWRMCALLEESGFELSQSFISWIYKTGFPKAYDVSQGIDKKLGVTRESKTLKALSGPDFSDPQFIKQGSMMQTHHKAPRVNIYETEPVSDLAKKWSGWKARTGLKPALEPILMVNKPFSESTIVDNVLRWGTGAINVDACRIPYDGEIKTTERTAPKSDGTKMGLFKENTNLATPSAKGRFPANLIISDGVLDTGEKTKSGDRLPHHARGDESGKLYNYGIYGDRKAIPEYGLGDVGDQSRYFDLDAWAVHHGFLDVPKPDTKERDFGLKGIKRTPKSKFNKSDGKTDRFDGAVSVSRRNVHPTVKPIKLMAYLIELGCPKNGVVLDPFVGSGTTCIAAKRLCRKYIGIELEAEYHLLAQSRVAAYPEPLEWFT